MCFHLFNASHILRSPQLLPSFHFPSLSMSLDLSVSPGGAGTRHIYILYTHILHYIISFLYIFSSFMLPGGAGLGGERARARGPDDQRLAYHPARPLRLRDAPAALPPHLPLRPRTGESSILSARSQQRERHTHVVQTLNAFRLVWSARLHPHALPCLPVQADPQRKNVLHTKHGVLSYLKTSRKSTSYMLLFCILKTSRRSRSWRCVRSGAAARCTNPSTART